MSLDRQALPEMLTRLHLTAIRDQLDSLLDKAAKREFSLREAVAFLCEREVGRRNARRITMATKIAHFPTLRDLDGFDFAAQPSLDKKQFRGIVRVNSILPARAPGRAGAPLFLLTNYRRIRPDSTPKIAYTYLP